MKIKTKLLLIALLLTYSAESGRASHLLNTEVATGRYINILDQVLDSCRGHFMCEVFPYYNTHGLICLNISMVCDGVAHCRDGSDEIPSMCQGWRPAYADIHSSFDSSQELAGAAQQAYSVPTQPSGGLTSESAASNQYQHMTANGHPSVDASQAYGHMAVDVSQTDNHVTVDGRQTNGHVDTNSDQAYGNRSSKRSEPFSHVSADSRPIYGHVMAGSSQTYGHITSDRSQTYSQPLELGAFNTNVQTSGSSAGSNVQYTQQPFHQTAKIHSGALTSLAFPGGQQQLQQQQNQEFPLSTHMHLGINNKNLSQGSSMLNAAGPSKDIGLNSTLSSNGSAERERFSHFTQYLGMKNNVTTSGLGTWFKGKQINQNPSSADYYHRRQKQIRTGHRSQGEVGAPPVVYTAFHDPVAPGPAYINSFDHTKEEPVGSSYQDRPVEPPHVGTPDGLIHAPGQEPYLLQEQSFLEEQFFLTDALVGSARKQQSNESLESVTGGKRNNGTNMLIGQQRQEQLLTQPLVGWSAYPKHQNNSVRYGLSGPFDGGVPTAPGEVDGISSMEGTEAQKAIHNLEALH